MKIVEYNNTFAASVADMWNRSNESWGNAQSLKTEEQVIAQENNSDNIKLYLAVDNEEVVGYCSFAEYSHDIGSSYLPLLNVRPDYHGKKVGKQLILKVLEDAIESKWSRFDLFTWSGNIKAMPLYKKCGFFWERREDHVHLMNFIPYFYQTEAFDEYREKIDWYKDNKRTYELEPDGDRNGEFEFYKYNFINDEIELVLEFEKTGRGLRKIDSPDYKIEMNIDKNKLVYDNEYFVEFVLENKTSSPIDIQISGVDDNNIEFSMEEKISLVGRKVLTSKFKVCKTNKVFDDKKTYPAVCADIYINGKLVKFKTGIEVQPPVKLDLLIPEMNHQVNNNYKAYLNIESNLSEDVELVIALPESNIVFSDDIELTLKVKEKKSIELDYSVDTLGFYSVDALVKFLDKEASLPVKAMVKGAHGSFYAETDIEKYLVSGNTVLRYNTNGKFLEVVKDLKKEQAVAFFIPALGKPFSKEFANIEPQITSSSNSLTLEFESKEFPEVTVSIVSENDHGLMKTWFEVVNNGEEKSLDLMIPLWFDVRNSIMPYDSGLLETTNQMNMNIGGINTKKIDSNWFYSKKCKSGFSWPEEYKLEAEEWRGKIIINDIELDKGESFTSKPFYSSIVHSSLEDFIAFVGEENRKKKIPLFDVSVNGGNPFTKEDVKVHLVDQEVHQLTGKFTINDKKTDVKSTIVTKPGLVNVLLDLGDRELEISKQTFLVEGDITKVSKENNYLVDNGKLSFSANSQFGPSTYSIKYDGSEWLNSTYPEVRANAWWALYLGGITFRPSRVRDENILKEEYTTEFVEINDNFGNKWEGIKNITSYKKSKKHKGLVLEQYTLTLPGTEVICYFGVIKNGTGKYLNKQQFVSWIDINSSDDKLAARCRTSKMVYKCNNYEVDREVETLNVFTGDRGSALNVYSTYQHKYFETQKDYNILVGNDPHNIKAGEVFVAPTEFLVFGEEIKTKEVLKDLNNIKFEV